MDTKTLPKVTKPNKTMLLVNELMEQNVRTKDIAELTEKHPDHISRVKSKLAKYKITHPQLLKKGKKAVNKILDDFMSEKDNVKSSDVVQVVKMQQDRIEPAVKMNQNLNINANYTRIDLSNYEMNPSNEGNTENRASQEVIDINE